MKKPGVLELAFGCSIFALAAAVPTDFEKSWPRRRRELGDGIRS